ncbi:MAG TPA: Hpt domain-containing protein, partial [Alphaproteobacteria bacterium]|nr:Hpt domain-containing protein [Alphaproteobacteria bacterium]
MNGQGSEFVEIFLGEASGNLQFLREYAAILQDPYPRAEDVERLYIAAHTLAGTSASYGFPLFSEVAGKLAHIFQYAMNATIAADAAGPLVEFVSEGVEVLESNLLMISANSVEATEDIQAFKNRYPFAFQTATQQEEATSSAGRDSAPVNAASSTATPASQAPPSPLPDDSEVPQEVLEFFVPEAEEHLQIVTDCLLSLETNPSAEQINRLLRAVHTVKGSAAQVGLHRIARVAHRAEDLIGRLRDGALSPSAEIIDICLESVDVLKKFLYHQWTDDAAMRSAVQGLFARIGRLVPEEAAEPLEAPARSETVEVKSAAGAVDHEHLMELELEGAGDEHDHEPATAIVPAAGNVAAPAEARGVETADREAELKKEPAAVPQSKSVRIALERLDRMMNAVGELVINRTRMLGRVAELERLADVLNFSKGRMQDKVAEFQEKYEFSRVRTQPREQESEAFPLRGGYSSYSHSFDHSLAEFSELEMDRYDDFNILSRS